MKFVYLIVVGLIVAIVATDILIHITKLENNIAAFIGLLVGMVVMAYNFTKGSFEKTTFKDFTYSVLIGIGVLIIATSIFIMLGISKQTSPYLIALLVGFYSFKKITKNKHTITDERKINKFIKTRKCPCCHEEVTFKYFFKHLKNRRNNFFTENEVGLLCPGCKKSIISAERKNKKTTTAMMVSMAPIAFFGLTGEFSLSLAYAIEFIFFFLLAFLIFLFALYRIHQKIEYICDDESSNAYNESF